MTLAEKVLRAKIDYDEVYSAGVDAGKAQGGSSTFPDGFEWAKYTDTVVIDDYDTFAEGETLTLNLPNVTDLSDALGGKTKKVKHLIVNCDKPIKTAGRVFYFSSSSRPIIERITLNVDFSQCTNMAQFFANTFEYLKIVDGTPINFSSATGIGQFCYLCRALEYIRIEPNSIKGKADFSGSYSLDNDSVQSIIDGLADLTGGTAQTLTLHADVIAELTDDQLTVIAQKNWNVA